MVADTAVSTKYFGANFSEQITTVGELEEQHKGKFVEEKAIKISNIKDKMVVSYAGNLDHIERTLEFFEENLLLNLSVIEILDYAINSFSYDDVQFIIGYFDSQEVAHLIYFDTRQYIEKDFIQIGSGSSVETWSNRVKLQIKQIEQRNFLPDEIIAILVSLLQSFSIKDRLMPLGVGGLFWGCIIKKDGIEWSSDTSYYFYTDAPSNVQLVTTMVRDNTGFSLSSFNSTLKIFLAREHIGNDKEFIHEWYDKASRRLVEAKTKFLVFYSPFYRQVTLIKLNYNLHNNLFRLWRKENSKVTDYFMHINPDLIRHLTNQSHFMTAGPILLFFTTTQGVEYISRKEFLINQGDTDLFEDWEEGYI
ncbi:hypothetical protein [Priestia megaterium]|uniref:hypothetical protein n=1 Tax=Priestia megaterium TaxID=1404 RepID=UPI0019521F98|nr:hypothetical protein [Priestia megaterium]MBM6601640.1 hypothetical protein [Priestia megaterium]